MATTPATEEVPGRTLGGLTDVEAVRRLAEHGRNEIPPAPAAPPGTPGCWPSCAIR
ncbi:cation-transporting P-type ATPase [Streptomyces sp. NPDC097617]|uniref:cation-transporting P-type ATPase n=1 Tax=Streptomyces sp. NPDC097617 TaxID=3366091 RepID=UPI00382E7011